MLVCVFQKEIGVFKYYYVINFEILQDVGEREGKYYVINVLLKDGIDDVNFIWMFCVVGICVF